MRTHPYDRDIRGETTDEPGGLNHPRCASVCAIHEDLRANAQSVSTSLLGAIALPSVSLGVCESWARQSWDEPMKKRPRSRAPALWRGGQDDAAALSRAAFYRGEDIALPRTGLPTLAAATG